MNTRYLALPMVLLSALLLPVTTLAVPEGDMPSGHGEQHGEAHGKEHGEDHGKMHGKRSGGHHGKKHKGMHHFSDHWAKTLSDDQKRQVDTMHLNLDRELEILKARGMLAEKELNALAAQDDPDMRAINAKIDELVDIKKRILRARYEHIVEMRKILTADQRISYDMGVLKRHGIK